MGEVYLAKDTKLDRNVALKILLAEVASDDARVRRFVQEAKAASALNHPNILTVYEIGTSESSNYIAAEFIKGRTLRDHNSFEPMTLLDVLDVAVQAAAALNAAHEAGIVHRDIKPENLMIRDDGLVKVLDFGLAKLTEKSLDLPSAEEATVQMVNTEPGMVMGTFAYMSPEQARGKPVDGRTDIWSLGVVLFELLAGRRPFEGEEAMDLMSSILKEPVPPLRQFSPQLPRQIERIVDKMLRKDLDNRYQHVKDLQIDVEDLRDELKFEERLGHSTSSTVAFAPTQTDSRNTHSTFHTATAMITNRRFNIFHALMFTAVIVGIAATFWWYRSAFMPTLIVPGSYKVQDVATWTSAPGELFSQASFSPDGKMIAFSSTRSKFKNIWVKQTTSTDALQVTKSQFADRDPIWSPDGSELAFFSERSGVAEGGSSVTGVWRVNALSGTPKSVGPIADGSCELRRWTQSGKIYYQSLGELYAMDVSSGVSEKVTKFAENNKKIFWVNISPDERQIAYGSNSEGHWQLFVSNLNDSNPTLAAEGTGEIGGVAWQPNKNRIYYSSAVNSIYQIFSRDLGKSDPIQITASATDNVIVDAASDLNSIIFSSVKEESNIWSVSVDDEKEMPIARSINSELWPAVSPDGRSITFQSIKNLSRGANLFSGSIMIKPMINDDNNSSTQLVEHGFLPTWSPDGSAVAYMKSDNGVSELFIVNATGGGDKQLAENITPTGYSISPYNTVQTDAFAWSPDGKNIAYVSEANGAANIWMVSQQDGNAFPVSNNRDDNLSFYCPLWSSDGKRIAFFTQSKKSDGNGETILTLAVVNIDTKETKEVFRSAKPIRLISWTPDETGLVIAESGSFSSISSEIKLMSINFTSGKEIELVALKNAYYYNIFASADRKQFAFVARNEHLDDIYIASANGGAAQKLTANNDSGMNFSRLAWTNDGSAIVFGKQTRFSLLSMISDIK